MSGMELELSAEQKVLLNDKNRLTESVLEQYRLAGQIAQTALLLVSTLVSTNNDERSIGEICRIGDKFLLRATSTAFKKQVEEKGIALPVQIERANFASNVAPEEDDTFQGGYLKVGDIVKISLGVHINGYTAQASHTVVIRDTEQDQNPAEEIFPLQGTDADAVCAAYIATEAVISLLSVVLSPDVPIAAAGGQITGQKIRALVEKIASIFRVKVAPGSRVRRVRRFLAGQSHVVNENDFKGYVWDEQKEEARELSRIQGAVVQSEENSLSTDFQDDFAVEAGEAWLVDIRMAATDGKRGIIRSKDFIGPNDVIAAPTIYSRDYSITYGLKVNAARNLLSKSAALTSVYPFKLSYIAEDKSEFNTAKLGLSEIVQHHIFVPHEIKTAQFIPLDVFAKGTPSNKEIKKNASPVNIAREMTTIVLIPASQSANGSSEVMRLTGGSKSAPPPWVHSKYEITDPTINELLNFRRNKKMHGINFLEVQPSKINFDEVVKQAESQSVQPEQMAIDNDYQMDA
ncbi:probable metalloprotease Arx1p [Trichomonascus vanleenenianus]|uniref:putative hydrolase n=1 Tax=Trichomonascus vanleenenianus TaxID=2268995 RepID=UPI003ECB119F